MKGLFQCPPRASPWVITDANLSPCKGKSFKNSRQNIKLLPFQGVLLIAIIPRALPWARSFWAFSPYLNHLRNLNKKISPKDTEISPKDKKISPKQNFLKWEILGRRIGISQ